jgi:hypothetical protein
VRSLEEVIQQAAQDFRRLLCRAHTPNLDCDEFDSGSRCRWQGHPLLAK